MGGAFFSASASVSGFVVTISTKLICCFSRGGFREGESTDVVEGVVVVAEMEEVGVVEDREVGRCSSVPRCSVTSAFTSPVAIVFACTNVDGAMGFSVAIVGGVVVVVVDTLSSLGFFAFEVTSTPSSIARIRFPELGLFCVLFFGSSAMLVVALKALKVVGLWLCAENRHHEAASA